MRKTLTAALFLTGLLLGPTASQATAPSLVEPAYDAAAGTLSVKIRHWSLFDGIHYIKYVDVKVNGALVSTNKYTNQPGNEYTYTYTVAAAPGDAVEVTARCNLWGSRTVEVKIPQAAGAPAPAPTPAQ